MPHSYEDYPISGGVQNFTIPCDYLAREHIHVYIDGVETNEFTFAGPYTIRLDEYPVGEVCRVRRITPKENALVDFVDGSTLRELELDASAAQMLFLAQEADDVAEGSINTYHHGVFDARGIRIQNVGEPEDPADAATKGFTEGLYNGHMTTIANALNTINTDKGTILAARDETLDALEDAEEQASIALDARTFVETNAGFIAVSNNLLGQDTIGIVAADLSGDNTIGTVAQKIDEVVDVAEGMDAVQNVHANMTVVSSVHNNMTGVLAAPAAASIAANARDEAVLLRNEAQNFAQALRGTSVSSVSPGFGSKTFETQADRQWVLGQRLRASNNAGTALMDGEIISYSGTTLVIDVDYFQGAGTGSQWNLSIVGAVGPQGPHGDLDATGASSLQVPTADGLGGWKWDDQRGGGAFDFSLRERLFFLSFPSDAPSADLNKYTANGGQTLVDYNTQSLSTGTSSNGYARFSLRTKGGLIRPDGVLIAAVELYQIAVPPSDFDNGYVCEFKVGSLTYGRGFRWTHDENGGRYQAICGSGGIQTMVDTGITPSSMSNFGDRLLIKQYGADRCEFFINDSLVATVNTNVYPSVGNFMIEIAKTSGTSPRFLRVNQLVHKVPEFAL